MRVKKWPAPLITRDSSGNYIIAAPSGKDVKIMSGVANYFQTNQSLGASYLAQAAYFKFNISAFNSINTAGLGVPAIYKAYASGSQNAALTTVGSYTPPSTAGTYRVNATVYCTVGTTTSFSVKVNYTDLNGTGHTDILPLVNAAAPGVFLTNGLVITAGTYYAMPLQISIDNSATPITFSTVGTFTTVTYFLNATLEQLA